MLIIVTVAVTLFGLSTTGRTIKAVRGSELASQSIGISPARARVITFAVSAFIAGLGGAMVSIHKEAVDYELELRPVRRAVLAPARRHVRRPDARPVRSTVRAPSR